MVNVPQEVGIDISTMEAVQSLFGGMADPWALECLANWVDVSVNHDKTFYALPVSLGDLPGDVIFPDILRDAEKNNLILPGSDQLSADQVDLTEQEITRLYLVFEVWASSNRKILKEWLAFTAQVRRIVAGRFIDEGRLNLWIREHFWHDRPIGWLITDQADHGISEDSQQFAFDMVVRAAQYHVAFGEKRAYQPHPIRALYAPSKSELVRSLSWGWLVINEIESGGKRWDSQRLIGTMIELRGIVREKHATARELLNDAPSARKEKLNSIAVRIGVNILPASFTRWIDILCKAIGVPLEIIGDFHHVPCIGLAWEVVQIPVKRGAEFALQHLKYIQRRVEFRGTPPNRSALDAVQRNLN